MAIAAEIVQAWFSGHAPDALASEVEFRDMTDPTMRLVGPGAVSKYLNGFYGAFETSGARIGKVYPCGEDTAVVEFTFWGRQQRAPLGAIAAGGRDADLPICALYRTQEGKICSITIYYNAATLNTQLA